VSGAAKTFTISVDSKSSDGGGTFSIELAANGDVKRLCTRPGKGGCAASADTAGNLW
jgi:hypothetical protein